MSVYSAWLYVIKQDNINNLSTFEKMTSLFFKQITEFMFLNPKPGKTSLISQKLNNKNQPPTPIFLHLKKCNLV